jgi:hypothetical protein
MNKSITPPNLDDETVAKINDFLYELLDAFESHYCYQILRHHRNVRSQQMQSVVVRSLFEGEGEDEDETPF